MDYSYLPALVGADFSRDCRASTFCRLCLGAVCNMCCQGHAASHHGIAGGAHPTMDVVLLEGMFPAVTAKDVRNRGLGYSWNKIQRIPHHGTNYVMLSREQPRWGNRHKTKGKCRPCGDRIQTANEHCSPACKLAHVQHGQSRNIIQALVSCDFTVTHELDRFCTRCLRPFCSQHCLNHGHHHQNEEFQVLTILRQDQRVFVPVDELPPVLVAAVKTVLTDGVLTVPLQRRAVPDPQGGGRPCTFCQEAVNEDDSFCCLQCKGGL